MQKSMVQKRNRRSRYEVIASIIQSARSARKTSIMYDSHVNLRQLNKYLLELVDAGLISLDSATRLYRATAYGLEYLTVYRDYDEARYTLKQKAEELKIRLQRAQKRASRAEGKYR